MKKRTEGMYLDEVYCEKCGSKMVDTFIHVKFAQRSGDELFHVHSKCPNKMHKFDGHNEFIRMEMYYDYQLEKKLLRKNGLEA